MNQYDYLSKKNLEYHNESKNEIIELLRSINYSVDIVSANGKTGMIYAKNKNL